MIWLIVGAVILTLVIVGLFVGIALMDGWRVSLAVAGIVIASLVVISGGAVALAYGISEVTIHANGGDDE